MREHVSQPAPEEEFLTNFKIEWEEMNRILNDLEQKARAAGRIKGDGGFLYENEFYFDKSFVEAWALVGLILPGRASIIPDTFSQQRPRAVLLEVKELKDKFVEAQSHLRNIADLLLNYGHILLQARDEYHDKINALNPEKWYNEFASVLQRKTSLTRHHYNEA